MVGAYSGPMGACMALLERCSSWEVTNLHIRQEGEEDMGEFWRRLAMATERGKVERILISKEAMVQGEVQDLRRVWEATELYWGIKDDEDEVRRVVMKDEEDGWEQVVRLLAEEEWVSTTLNRGGGENGKSK